MKKIIIFLSIGILLSSCGKKGDPFYEEKKEKKVHYFSQKVFYI